MADQSDALTVRADHSRNHLSQLVDQLKHQVTPAELVSQLVGRRRATPNAPSFAETLTAQVRKNPIACALIAAGVGWLMMAGNSERSPKAPRRRRNVRRRATTAQRETRKQISRK